jgi:hypothetical protein
METKCCRRKSMIRVAMGVLAFFFIIGFMSQIGAESVKEKVKDVAHEGVVKTKEAARAVKKGTKRAFIAVKEGARNAGHEIKESVKETGHTLKESVTDSNQ